MWEAIRANKRRSVVLIALLGTLLMLLGFVAGEAIHPEAGLIGLAVAFGIWFVLWLTAIAGGRKILLSSAGARQIEHDDYPVVFNVVEEMSIAAGLAKVPRVYILDSDAPNAFAVGTEDNAAVAVTTGLLMRLNRDELQGVVAHEIGHIKNHDTNFMMVAGVMVAAIVILSDILLRTMIYGGGGRRRSSRRGGGGGAQAVMALVALVLAILAPMLAQLLYLACSRRREYLADACSAQYTRYPEGLASALQKISGAGSRMKKVNRALAPMFTVNPLKGSAARSMFSTHPPTDDRVRVLRAMGGAAYADYQAAYSGIHQERILGARTVAESQPTALRQPSAEPEKADLEKAREAVDILHRMSGMLFLTCACGLRIKVPPSYERPDVNCPRCRKVIPIPVAAATLAAAAAAAGELGPEAGALALSAEDAKNLPEAAEFTHTYTPGQWQSFRCPCDRTINLSPSFSATQMRCSGCGRTIRMKRA